MRSIFKSKTVWYAIAVAVLSVLQGFVFLLPMTPVNQMLVGCGIAVGIVVLRFLTNAPLYDK